MDGKELLKKHFHIEADRIPYRSEAMCYESNGLLYLIVEVTKKEQQYLNELHQMSQHMIRQGEKRIAAFMPDQSGYFLIVEGKKEFVVLVSKRYSSQPTLTGGKLARFHLRGRSIPVQMTSVNEFGRWKENWEQRLEKLEKAAGQLVKEQDDPFARLVVEAFPYYMGLAENAIQYVADTEMDESPGKWDTGTICQWTFSEKAWLSEPAIRQPFDWVFDHAARDIAEWIRSHYWQGSLFYRSRFTQFLQEYEQVRPLSPFTWRLIYARLLFPVHYFECAENYFSAASLHIKKENEEKLKKYTVHSPEHEQFLAFFYEWAGVPVKKLKIPDVQWLK
ncbi:spore coat protein YutH [Bacillus aerolatus]|uniref:Spore coat protein YutH n=1 Tax=Bacillus aerolatus TaxID=2653354 RepID=A0A6I1FK22_9BACI|nr:spore coat protein YutH [Bacillus aerolatus]KAB7706992.1 spore coat protein YutH [Bacillus aerolatus]